VKALRYAEYRPSGVNWLGSLPKSWRSKRIKFVAQLSKDKANSAEVDLPYIGLEHIESWTGKIIEEGTASSAGTVSLYRRGDVLFGKLRPYLAKVTLAHEDGCCSTEALVLRSGDEILPGYLRYYLCTNEFISNVDGASYGSKMPRASWEFIGSQISLLPPLDEQRAIIRFLDAKTAEIDDLITKKLRLLELLVEQRTALITKAVTKGLTSDARMKPSSVSWLGNIPAHWQTIRLAMAMQKITNGYVGPTRDILVDEGVKYLQSLHIKDGAVDFQRKPYFVTEEWSADHRKSILRTGDILIVQTGQVGQVCSVPHEFDGANCHALILCRLREGVG
jgi:type I restriction enzyme, S subunit